MRPNLSIPCRSNSASVLAFLLATGTCWERCGQVPKASHKSSDRCQVSNVDPAITGHQELQRPSEMRRVLQHADTLVQRAYQHVVLLNISPLNSFFEVPDSAMYDLRRRTGRRTRKVTRLQKHRSNSAQLCIQCTRRASHPPH